MKQLTLEIVRDGPTTNRLLSPTTPYIALCENHPPVTLRLGFEHVELLRWQRDLRYARLGPADAGGQARPEREGFERATSEMTTLLGSIPTLTSEIGPLTDPNRGDDDEPLVNLRLVLSPLEIASLPFECALAPTGYRGAGLSLARELGVTITREVHRQTTRSHEWSERPRVLVATPDDDPDVPLRAHVAALYSALREHLGWDEDPIRELGDYLTVRTRVTLEDLAAESAKGYTHVHILAHGTREVDEIGRAAFRLRFRTKSGQTDRVSGDRLAEALKPCGRLPPSTVTLAVCDGGNVGDVLLPAGSVAHQLHVNGFPLVVASQFPLTFQGSVILTQVFYDRLLRGGDPRHAVHCARRALHTRLPDTYDWASVVAYASISPELERQLESARERVEGNLADTQLARTKRQLARLDDAERLEVTRGEASSDGVRAVEQGLDALDEVFGRYARAMRVGPLWKRARAARAVASMCLRWVDALCGLRPATAAAHGTSTRRYRAEAEGSEQATTLSHLTVDELLEQASFAYEIAYTGQPEQYWAFVQMLVVQALRRSPGDKGPTTADWRFAVRLVSFARKRAEELSDDAELARIDAHEAELALLGLLLPAGEALDLFGTALPPEAAPRLEAVRPFVQERLDRIKRAMGVRSFQLFSAWRGVRRYSVLLADQHRPVLDLVGKLAKMLEDMGVPQEWRSRARR